MHREGWRFTALQGHNYEFEKCEGEDWNYQLDFKENGVADGDYIQMFTDYGWEYVFQYRNWFYFRKIKTEGCEEDLSIFSDNESKIELYRRIINSQSLSMVPLYLIVLAYNYLMFFTPVFKGDSFWNGLALGCAMAAICVVIFSFGIQIGQYSRLNKMIKDLEHPVK
jgi:hypothetical protein